MSGAGTSATGSGAPHRVPAHLRRPPASRTTAPARRAGARCSVWRSASVRLDDAERDPGGHRPPAVRGGLAAKVGWKNGPDLVVTGANSGPNVAAVTNDSAPSARRSPASTTGSWAIALSAGMDMDTFKVTERTYRAFADFVPGFVPV
ncbi:5'/3'-nucleotidase SurE [Yinghuangia aomiensis]